MPRLTLQRAIEPRYCCLNCRTHRPSVFRRYLFEPWADQQPGELCGLCEAGFASLGGVYSEKTYSTDAGVDGVAVYYSSHFYELTFGAKNRNRSWLIRNRRLLFKIGLCSDCRSYCCCCTRIYGLLNRFGTSGYQQQHTE